MNYYIFITGCQQNYYDAEKITHLLNQMGYLDSGEKKADLFIVMGCSVRKKPVDRIYGKIKNWRKLSQNPKIIVTGCVLPRDKRKMSQKADAIINVKNINKELPKLLNNKLKIENLKLKIGNKSNSFIPIMSGCDNFCTYCAVPYTRGREVSRDVKDIINEIKELVKNHICKITLLGQNVNSYKGINKPGERYTFTELLWEIKKIKGLKKISFLTAHPKDMSDELIEWMGKSKLFSKELHLPLQSGDDEILAKMNRHYTGKSYFELVKALRSKIKNLILSTDIIVGFPEETEEQYQNTYNLCKKINFEKAYIAMYSPRQGTVAAKLKDDVSYEEKKKRWDKLEELIYRSKHKNK